MSNSTIVTICLSLGATLSCAFAYVFAGVYERLEESIEDTVNFHMLALGWVFLSGCFGFLRFDGHTAWKLVAAFVVIGYGLAWLQAKLIEGICKQDISEDSSSSGSSAFKVLFCAGALLAGGIVSALVAHTVGGWAGLVTATVGAPFIALAASCGVFTGVATIFVMCCGGFKVFGEILDRQAARIANALQGTRKEEVSQQREE